MKYNPLDILSKRNSKIKINKKSIKNKQIKGDFMKDRVSFFIKKYKKFFIKYVNKSFFSVMSLQRVTTAILLCKVKREKIMKKLENNIQDKDLLNQYCIIDDDKRKVTLNLDKVENYSKLNDSKILRMNIKYHINSIILFMIYLQA